MDKAAFRHWIQAENDAEDQGRNHALKMMRVAIREELTEKQFQYINAYYAEGISMTEIAALYGVDRSTVSRTIGRARNRLKKILRYCSPILLKSTFDTNLR